MSDFRRFRRNDRADHNPAPQPTDGGFSAPISRPDLGVKRSRVGNEYYQDAYKNQIDAERRDAESRRREAERNRINQSRDQEAAKKEQAAQLKAQKEHEKKQRNASIEANARKRGAKIYKDEFGDFQAETDEDGRQLFSEFKSDVYDEDKTGRKVVKKRDRYGRETVEDADADVKWTIGENGKLVKKNKHNKPEERDAQEFLDHDEYGELAKSALFKNDLAKQKRKVAEERLALRDPSLSGLSEDARGKIEQSIEGFKAVGESDDSPQVQALKQKLEADDALRKRKADLHALETETLELENGGVGGWDARRQAARRKEIAEMGEVDFSKNIETRKSTLKDSVDSFQSDFQQRTEHFTKLADEIQEEKEALRAFSQKLNGANIQEYRERQQSLAEKHQAFESEYSQYQAVVAEKGKSIAKAIESINADIATRNAALKANAATQREDAIAGAKKAAESLTHEGRELNPAEAKVAQAYEAYSKELDFHSSADEVKSAIDRINAAQRSLMESDLEDEQRSEKVYKMLSDWNTEGNIREILLGKDRDNGFWRGLSESFGDAVEYGTNFGFKSGRSGVLLGGGIDENSLIQIRALLPGKSDKEIESVILDSVKSNYFSYIDEDPSHVLDNGRVVVNPGLIFFDSNARSEIKKSNTSEFRREQALKMLTHQQKELAAPLHAKLLEYSDDYAQFVKGNPEMDKTQTLIRFHEENEGAREFWKSTTNATKKGLSNLGTSVYGAAYGLTALASKPFGGDGWDLARELMEYSQEMSEGYEAVSSAEGHLNNFYTDVVKAAPSLIPTLASGGLGRGAQALTKVAMAGRGTAVASRYSALAGQIVGQTSMYGSAFAQSYGGAISDRYAKLKVEFGEEKAMELISSGKEQVAAASMGVTTALLIKMNPGGAESIVNGSSRMLSMKAKELVKLANARGGVQKLFTDKVVRAEVGKMLKETVWHGVKDEAVEESLDQFFQGVIDSIAHGGDKTLNDIILESIHAGAVGGVLGGGVSGITGNIGKADPIGMRLAELREAYASELQAPRSVVEEIELAQHEARMEDPTLSDMSREELGMAAGMVPEFGKSSEAAELYEAIEQQEVAAQEAFEAGDIERARDIVGEVRSNYKAIGESHKAAARRAVKAVGEIASFRATATEELRQAQASHQEAIALGDKQGSALAVGQIEEARAKIIQAHQTTGLAKLAAGKPVSSLTMREANLLGVKRDFSTGDGGYSLMSPAELSAQGVSASPVDIVGDRLIVTDEGVEIMSSVSPASSEGVTKNETKVREEMAAKASAEAQAQVAEPAPTEKTQPEGPKEQSAEKAKQSTWTARGKNGTKVSVEASGAEQARAALATKLGKASPGELLDLDSVRGSESAQKTKTAKPKDSERKVPVFRKKALTELSSLPKKEQSKAVKLYRAIEEAIDGASKDFDGVKVVGNLTGAGLAVEGGQLLIDPKRIVNQVGNSDSKSVGQWLKAALVEERIHKASLDVVGDEEATDIWEALPAKVRRSVEESYDLVAAQAGREARSLDAVTGFHEFVRMVIQKDSDVLGFITEEASLKVMESGGQTLTQKLLEVLGRILDHLGSIESKDKSVHEAVNRVRAAMGLIEKQIHQEAAKVSKERTRPTESKKLEGFLPNGESVEFKWEVVDLATDNVVVSNRDTGAVNPDYPQELQPRDRSSATSNAQVQDIAQNTKYARLSDNPSVGDGAPMIGADGVVESGNGRMMGLRRAYQEGYSNVEQYRSDLTADAESKGIDPQKVKGMRMPVLVRVRADKGMSRREFVELANVSTVSSMRESERAQTDAERLTRNPETLRNLDVNANGELFTPANADFFKAFVSGVPANERGEMVSKNGSLNATGLRRISNALIAAAYDTESSTLARLTESIDTEGRNLMRVMVALAPEFAEQGARMKAGVLYPDLNITNDLAKAVAQTIQLRESGEKVSDYLKQANFGFDGDTQFSDDLIAYLEENKLAPKRVIGVFQKYNQMVEVAGNPQDGDMFGDTPSREALWETAKKSGVKLDAGPIQDDLFSGGEDMPLFTQKERANEDMFPTIGLELFDNAEANPAKKGSGKIKVQAFDTDNKETTVEIEKLPFDPSKYFLQGGDAQQIPLEKIQKQRARAKGIKNANKFMHMAYEGEGTPRKGITLISNGDGTYELFDGNSTYANAVASGWPTITARVMTREQAEADEVITHQAKAAKKAIAEYEEKTGEKWPHKVDENFRSNWKITAVGTVVKNAATGEVSKVEAIDLAGGQVTIGGQKMNIKEAQKTHLVQLGKYEAILEEAAIKRLTFAESIAPGYAKDVNEMAAQFSVRADPLTAPVKGLPRLLEKNSAKLKTLETFKNKFKKGPLNSGDVDEIINANADLVRASIIMSDIGSKLEGLQIIKNRFPGAEIMVDDRFMKPVPGGYSDIQLKVEIAPGFNAELQLHIPEMFASKEGWFDAVSEDYKPSKLGFLEEEGGLGHKLFEEWRALKNDIDEGAESTPKMKDLEARMAALYGKAKELYLSRAEREGLHHNFLITPSKINKYSLKSTSLTQGAVGSGMTAGTLSSSASPGISSTPPAIATGNPSTSQNSQRSGNISRVGNKKAINHNIDSNAEENNSNLENADLFGSVSTTDQSNEKSSTNYTGNSSDTGAKNVDSNGETQQELGVAGQSGQRVSGLRRIDARQSRVDGRSDARSGNGAESNGNLNGYGQGTNRPNDSTASGQTRPGGTSLANKTTLRVRPENEADRNAVINPSETLSPKGLKAKANANIEAIRLLKVLEDEGRNPTTEEKKTLLAYSGWGALSQALDRKVGEQVEEQRGRYTWDSPAYNTPTGFITKLKKWDNKWGDTYRALKESLSEEQFNEASRSTLNAHYTTPEIINGIWSVVEKLGFSGGTALEPGAGVGHFIGTQPQHLAAFTDWTGVELDGTSARILSKLYPEARVNSSDPNPTREVEGEGFEEAIIPNNSIDIAISNVPFAKTGPHQSSKEFGQKLNLHNYFFARSLDKVRPGGVVAYITTSNTMESAMQQRELLASKGELIGALRLPNTAFKENAGTEVTTDVIFLRKPTGARSEFAQDWRGKKQVGTDTVSIKPFSGYKAPTHAEFYEAVAGVDPEWVPSDPKLAKAWEVWVKNKPSTGGAYTLFRKVWHEVASENDGKVYFEAPIMVNEYFANNPQNVIGKHTLKGSMYSANEYTVEDTGQSLTSAFEQFAESLPADIMGESKVAARKPRLAEKGDQVGDYVEKDGKIYSVDGDTLSEVEWKPGVRNAFKSWRKVVDATSDLLNAEQTSDDEAAIEEKRAELNKVYDKHVKLFGPFSKKKGVNLHKDFSNAPKFVLTEALEEEVKVLKGKKSVVEYRKADIFSKRLNRPYDIPESAETLEDAITQSLTWVGELSPTFVAKQLGRGADEVEAVKQEMIDKGLAFLDPSSGLAISPDEYLSGPVGRKLEVAKAAAKEDKSFEGNVKALEKAMPERINISNITATLGARWIPTEVITEFMDSEMGISNGQVEYRDGLNDWAVGGTTRGDGKYSTESHLPTQLIDAALNSKRLTVRRKSNGETVTDINKTMMVNSMIDRIKRDFARWVRVTDKEIKGEAVPEIVEEVFNKTANNFVPPTFKGEHITLPGASDEVYRTGIRRAVVARMLSQGGGMIAHGVGFGKTYTLISLAMEMKRLGKANKPMVVVQNSTAKQFAASIKKAYPGAKVLIANEDTFSAKNRKKLTAQIATGDWDLVMVTQSQIGLIPSSPDTIKSYISEQLDELDVATVHLKGKSDEQSKRTVKELEKAKAALVERRKSMLSDLEDKQDNSIHWEELGVDALLVDEAHNFKNAPFVTKKGRIKGISQGSDSQRAINMMLKTGHIQKRNNGKGIFFATGTPVTNSLVESYTMLKFVSPNILKDEGITTFDEFADRYGTTVDGIEPTWKGNIESVTRFSKFTNGQSLINLIRSSWDVEMNADAAGLKRPKVKGGGPELIIQKRTDAMTKWGEWVVDTAKRFKNTSKAERDANKTIGAIPIMTMQAGLAAALDPRLVHPDAEDEPGSKTNEAVRRIVELYKKDSGLASAQVVFTDIQNSFNMEKLEDFNGNPFGASGATNKFNYIADLKRKLVEAGVKAGEIAIVNGSVPPARRKAIFDKVNSGEIRVVIGSTETLGVGVNIQERLKAAHHLMPPKSFKPADMEQRNGRILRQGNLHYDLNEEIEILNYAVEGSMDSAVYAMMAKKQNFIVQILMGQIKGDSFEDPGDEVSASMEEIAARAMGDPDLIRMVELTGIVKKMQLEEQGFIDALQSYRNGLRSAKARVADIENRLLPDARGQVERVKPITDVKEGEYPVWTFGDAHIDRNPPKNKPKGWKAPGITKEVTRVLTEELRKLKSYESSRNIPLEVNGVEFTVQIHQALNQGDLTGEVMLKGDGQRKHYRGANSLIKAVSSIVETKSTEDKFYEGRLESNKNEIVRYEKQIKNHAWEDQDKLDSLRKELEELKASLAEKAAEREDGKRTLSAAAMRPEYDVKKSVKADILANPSKHFPRGYVKGMLDEIRTWKVAIKSPWSNSAYNITNKPKSGGPDGFKRLSDHWNYEVDYLGEGIHGRTDKHVPKGAWAMGQYNAKTGLYEIKKVWDLYGNPIPPSRLPKTGHKPKRLETGAIGAGKSSITTQQDAEYLSAVESGDMAKAQEMVDLAAKNVGYREKWYHGMINEGFDVFDKNKAANSLLGKGFYFTSDYKVAESYSSKNPEENLDIVGKIEQLSKKEGISYNDAKSIISKGSSKVGDFFIKEGRTLYIEEGEIVFNRFSSEWFNGVTNDNGQEIGEIKGAPISDDLIGKDMNGVMDALRKHNAISAFTGIVENAGFKSITFEGRTAPKGKEGEYQLVVFNPNQIKSADPVTYDADGKVIPLSERFNEKSNSILQSSAINDDPVAQLMAELDAELPTELEHYVTEAAKETEGGYTYGNPDLAYGASDPIARGVDHARALERERINAKTLNKEAERLIAEDEEGVLRDLFDAAASGTSLNHPALVRAAALLRVKLSKEAIRTGDKDLMKKAQILTWAYRETGTTWAREGFARRDLHKSPADRIRDFIMDSVVGNDPTVLANFKRKPEAAKMLKRIDNLKEMLEIAKAKGNEKVVAKVEENLGRENTKFLEAQNAEFDEYRSRVEGALKAMGVSLDDILGDRVTLKLKARNLMAEARRGFNLKQTEALALIDRGISVTKIVKETGLSRRQISDTLTSYRTNLGNLLNKFGDEVFETGGDLFSMDDASALLESAKLQSGKLSEEERQRRIRMVMKAMNVPETLVEYEKKPKPRKAKKNKKITSLTAEQLAELEERFEKFKKKGFNPDTLHIQNESDLDGGQSRQDFEKFKNKPEEMIQRYLERELALGAAEAESLATSWNNWQTNPNVGSKWIEQFESSAGVGFDINNPEHVAAVRGIIDLERPSRWVDAVKELFINNILSAPITQITNLTGMAFAAYEMTIGRALQATFNLGLKKDGPSFDEFGLIFRGLKGKIAQSFDLAVRAFNEETSPIEKEFLDAQLELGFNPMHDSRGFRPVIKGLKGRVIRTSGRSLLFTDTFFKSLIGLMEVGAMAYRLGRANGLAKGSQELEDFVSVQSSTPGSASWRAAVEKAEIYTFTNALRSKDQGGNILEAAVKKVGEMPRHGGTSHFSQVGELLATMFFPFITTPLRLLQLGMGKTVYGGAFNVMRALGGLRVRNGKLTVPSISDAQKLQMLSDGLFASVAFGVLWGLAEGDDDDDDKWLMISGSANRTSGERGLQYRTLPPNSIRIGDKVINYGRLDPFSTVIGTTVDTIRAIKLMRDGQKQEKALAQLQSWFVSQVEGKTVMRGMQDLGSLVKGEKNAAEWGVNQLASVLVPNLVRNPLRNLDQTMRDTRTEPFSKESLVYTVLPNPWVAPPAKKDVYGREVTRRDDGIGGWMNQALNPLRTKDAPEVEKWDEFLLRYNRHNPNDRWAPTPPRPTYKKVVGGKDEKMTADEYSKFVDLRAKVLRSNLNQLGGLVNKAKPTVDDKDELAKAMRDATRFAKKYMFPQTPQ